MASKANLEKKQAYVQEVSEKIKNANIGIIISYKGIDSKEATQMRKELREAEVDYFVIKNTMLKLASEQAGFDFSNELVGTTAIALGNDDPVTISKILTNYAKKLKETTEFKIKTGFLDGKLIDIKTINELGSLPSKEQLIGQLLSVLSAPVRGLAISLSEIAKTKNASEDNQANATE